MYRKARDEWEQHLKDIRTSAKAKAAATVTEKQQQQQVQAANGDINSITGTAAGTGAGSGHSKASSAGKKRADSITEELRREVYGAAAEECAVEGSAGESGAESESASVSDDAAGEERSSASKKKSTSDDLVVLRKVESKPKSAGGKGKGPVSKADAVLSHVDIEVQVMDGDGADGGDPSSSISVKGKKRKLSKNGFITSHSTKHHSNEANRLVVTKKARLGLAEGAVPSTGMFASSTASSSVASGVSPVAGSGAKMSEHSNSRSIFSGSADLDAVGLGGSGGVKVRSIADVDRAMQKKQLSAKKSKK